MSQQKADEIADDLAFNFRVSRNELHISVASRGLIHGNIEWTFSNGVTENATRKGLYVCLERELAQ